MIELLRHLKRIENELLNKTDTTATVSLDLITRNTKDDLPYSPGVRKR